MKKVIIFVSLSVFALFTWAIWIARAPPNPYAQKVIPRIGVVYDLEKRPNMFDIQGFTFHKESPFIRKKQLKAEKVWALGALNKNDSRSSKGKISIGGFQRARRRLKDVTILIKYHLSWDKSAFLTLKGTDMTKSEQVQEDLPQDGDGFCTRIVFLGPVHEVELEAKTMAKAYLMIDEFKIAVGSPAFDKMEEVTCQ